MICPPTTTGTKCRYLIKNDHFSYLDIVICNWTRGFRLLTQMLTQKQSHLERLTYSNLLIRQYNHITLVIIFNPFSTLSFSWLKIWDSLGLFGQLEIIKIIPVNCMLMIKQEKLENIKAWDVACGRGDVENKY